MNKYIDFISIENINEAKEILQKTLLIDFEKCDWFNQDFLEDTADFRDYYDTKFLDISLKEWVNRIHEYNNSDYIFYKLHKAVMSILKNYKISLQDYFPNVEAEIYCLSEIEGYVLNNMKFNLAINKEIYSSNDQYISIKDAMTEYIKFNKFFKNRELRETLMAGEKIDYESLSGLYSKLKNNLDELVDDENTILKQYNLYRQLADGNQINKVASHTFIYTLDHLKKFLYNEKNYKGIMYNDIKNFFEEFFKSNITIMDTYLFEEIYSIYYKLYGYIVVYRSYTNEKMSEREKEIVKETIIELIQLPNWIQNDLVINKMMRIFYDISNFDSLENYKDKVKKMCIHLNCYFMPLYNMTFSNILNCYCNLNNISIIDFLKDYLKDEEIVQEYKNKYVSLYKIGALEKRKQGSDEGITNLIEEIMNKEKEYKFYSNDLIEEIGLFGEKISTLIRDKESYQINFKKFILDGIIN